jgi:hypothetical protein
MISGVACRATARKGWCHCRIKNRGWRHDRIGGKRSGEFMQSVAFFKAWAFIFAGSISACRHSASK